MLSISVNFFHFTAVFLFAICCISILPKTPGLDPRKEFSSLEFSSEINDIDDLQTGMELEGIVTNVTNFGAFVDIGVHQDGLVHISQICDRFIRHPSEMLAVGDIVNVVVLEVDEKKKRISLSIKQASFGGK